MSELLPCPHHKDAICPKRIVNPEALATYDFWEISYECPECGCSFSDTGETEEEADERAIAGWNERYERTCQNRSVEGKHLLMCSICGAFTKVTNATESIGVRYCGNCGSKVVDS